LGAVLLELMEAVDLGDVTAPMAYLSIALAANLHAIC
jgi:hypothetical protein